MKKYVLFLFVFAVIFFSVSCSEKENYESKELLDSNCMFEADVNASYAEETTPADQSIETEDIATSDRKLIKEADISFETSDLDQTNAFIKNQVKFSKGYISSENNSNTSYSLHNKMTIRIPSENFDTFIDSISSTIEVFTVKKINVIDVTETFVDVKARLKSKKELESRYLTLLGRANTISEILEIERNLATVREEIESVEARFNSLSNSIAYSTIYLDFYKNISEEENFGNEFSEALNNGWDGLVEFSLICLTIWPFFVFSILIAVLIVFLVKRKRRRRANKIQSKTTVN